jgi:hypothetical protein
MPLIDVAARLQALDLTGTHVPHERMANLGAISKLLAGEPFYTFGIKTVAAAVQGGGLDMPQVLGHMARLTGCSADPAERSGPGYIDPTCTLAGLRRLADRLAEAVQEGLTITFGTGHPGCLIGFWQPLAQWAAQQGARVITGPVGQPVGPGQVLDAVGLVGVVSDGASLLHHHATRAAEAVLESADVALLFGDHGWAGAAINAGVPCVAIMDTNDPGLALAHALGVPGLDIVPCGDNSPNGVMGEVAEWVIQRAAGRSGPLD